MPRSRVSRQADSAGAALGLARRSDGCFSAAGRRFRRDEAGVAMIEFALVVPVFLLLLLGMIDLGKAFNYWIDETHLANETARWAAVDRNPGPGGTLTESMLQQGNTAEFRAGGSESLPDAAQIQIGFPNGTCDVGDPVEVTVSVEYHWLPFLRDGFWTPGFSIASSTITGKATMRLEARPTSIGAGCA